MPKFWKIIGSLFLVWGFLLFSLNYSYATDGNPHDAGQTSVEAGLDSESSTPASGSTIETNPNALLPFAQNANYPGFRVADDVKGAQGVVSSIGGLFNTAKQLLAPIMVFLIVGFGIRMIIAGGNEEEFSKATKHFFYLLVGTAFVIFSKELSDIFTLYGTTVETGGTAADPTTFIGEAGISASAGRITNYFDIVITFVRYIFGGIALFYVIKSGSAILFNADEEAVTQQKEVFTYGFAGFILIIVSEALVRVVFGLPNPLTEGSIPVDTAFTPGINVGGGLSLLGNVTNLLLGIMGGLFLFTLVVGGVMYSLSAGNEERGQKATKLIIGSVLGLVIAFSSYTLVTEFSRGQEVATEVIEGTS